MRHKPQIDWRENMACSKHYHLDEVTPFQSTSARWFGLSRLVVLVFRVVERARARTEQLKQLDMLLWNDRLRADAGVSLSDVQQEYYKLLWWGFPRSRPLSDQRVCHKPSDGIE
jgi:uncharacterized protein YjiS (DUF1127 family)